MQPHPLGLVVQDEFTYQPGSVLKRRLGRGRLWHYGIASEFVSPEGEQLVYQFGGPYEGEMPYNTPGTKILNMLWPTYDGKGYTGVHVGLTPLNRFAEGREVLVDVVPENPIPVLQRAKSLMNHGGYNLVNRNCEHFASYALTGSWSSSQSQRLSLKGIAVLVVAVVGGAAFAMKGGE
jgi:hypothetical protein